MNEEKHDGSGGEQYQQEPFYDSTAGSISKGDVTLEDPQGNSAADLQSPSLPLQKKEQKTVNGKVQKFYRKDKTAEEKLSSLGSVSKFVSGRLDQLKVFTEPTAVFGRFLRFCIWI